MSPMRLHQDDQEQQRKQQKIIRSNKEYQINGARPTPLQLHKSSHVIHKSSAASSSSSSISTACSSTTISPTKHNQRCGPVIIYTHSPKVIHTQPHDFMALVQKLTGLSSVKQSRQREMAPPRRVNESVSEDDPDGTGSGVAQDLNLDYGSSDTFDKNDRTFLSEIPLFTPTGLDMFRSPQAHQQQQFRFPGDTIFSPATLEFLKPLPEC